jgi:anti-sigma B factor antagonist
VQNGKTPEHQGPSEAPQVGVPAASDTPAVAEETALTDDDVLAQMTDDSPASSAPEPPSVHVIVLSDRTRIVLSGEIDADLGSDLREAMRDAEGAGLPIEVDAQHVTFMDSSGIAFLARLASRSNDRVRVLHAPDAVRFPLEVTKIGELLDLVEDTQDAGPGAPPTAADPLPRAELNASPDPDAA